MISQGVVLDALYAHLRAQVPAIPLFQSAPPDMLPPYGMVHMETWHPGNGLPPPHFYTEGVVGVRLWGPAQGGPAVVDLLHQLGTAVTGKSVPCKGGRLGFHGTTETVPAPLPTAQKKWREGVLNIKFWYQSERTSDEKEHHV